MTEKMPTTPAGKLRYPSLNKPDDRFAEGDPTKAVYQTQLILPAEEAQEIIDMVEEKFEEWKAGLATPERKKIKKDGPRPWEDVEDEDGNETGEIAIRFKKKSQTAKGVKMRPVLVDAKRNPINPNGPMIGTGSTARINYSLYFWNVPSLGASVTLQINAVQILDLVEYSGGVSVDDAFDEEDGFEAVDDDGFKDEGDDEDGDY